MIRNSCAGLLFLAGLATTLSSPMQAQTCSGNQGFSGPYLFTAVRLAFVPQSTNPPGTTDGSLVFNPQAVEPPGTTGQYSNTPIGQLVGLSSNAGPFSSVGRILADGAGVIYASRANDPTSVRVGTYSVAPDCTISITFTDAFSTVERPGVTYRGVLTDRGNQASVVQSTQGSGVLLTFKRPFLATGCNNMSLDGPYGLSGSGIALSSATPNTTSPLTYAHLFTANGAGVVGSPVGDTNVYTGSYSVNTDCTGTLTLVSPDKATTRRYAFVLTSQSSGPGQLPRPSVELVLSDPAQSAGYFTAQ